MTAIPDNIRCRGCWEIGNNCGLCSHCIATRPPAPPLVTWMLCCNDRHGNDTNRMESAVLYLGNSMCELEGPTVFVRFPGDEERVKFRGIYKRAPHMLKVYSRGRIPVWEYKRHVGNIHWDQIGTSLPYTPHMLRWLRLAGWAMISGPCPIMESFEECDPAHMLADYFDAAMLKAMEESAS